MHYHPQVNRFRLVALTLAALIGFASNSLLCRMALLHGGTIDPVTFTTVRIAAGALMLALLVQLRSGSSRGQGSWLSASALFAYAIAFSLAYVRLAAGTGALILFSMVQATMIVVALRNGEKLRPLQWLGLIVALAGLVVLVAPGVRSPDPRSAALMSLAGVAWGIYSLRGRRSSDPLASTAGNFLRAVPFALVASLASLMAVHASTRGVLLAAASGALASGIGYSFWYAVVPRMPATRAAILQLSVPLLTAAGGILFLHEAMTTRLLLAGVTIVGGIALSVIAKK